MELNPLGRAQRLGAALSDVWSEGEEGESGRPAVPESQTQRAYRSADACVGVPLLRCAISHYDPTFALIIIVVKTHLSFVQSTHTHAHLHTHTHTRSHVSINSPAVIAEPTLLQKTSVRCSLSSIGLEIGPAVTLLVSTGPEVTLLRPGSVALSALTQLDARSAFRGQRGDRH